MNERHHDVYLNACDYLFSNPCEKCGLLLKDVIVFGWRKKCLLDYHYWPFTFSPPLSQACPNFESLANYNPRGFPIRKGHEE